MTIYYYFKIPKAKCPICETEHPMELEGKLGGEGGSCKLGKVLTINIYGVDFKVLNRKKFVVDRCHGSCYKGLRGKAPTIFTGKVWIEDGIFTKYKAWVPRKFWWED